jgi:RNA polymerase sigma-70 factor (ECF subfamily)
MLNGDEEKLIKAAVGGDSSAFGSLYDHYQAMIYRFVVIKVGSREEAEDITHQVFLSAWQKVRTYKHQGHPFSSWLYRIARNQVIDHYRARKGEVSIDKIDPELFASVEHASDDLAKKFQLENVRKAIAALKTDYQDVIIMRFVEDISLKETAAILKKSEGAIKLIQHRAVKELKKALGDETNDITDETF